MRKVLLIAPLIAVLALSIWYAAHSFTLEGPDMPWELYLAMVMGILFSLLIGCGLMVLLFYSSRHGYDEAAHRPDHDRHDRA
ncbi:MAG TPA: hypothetical protein VNL39_07165 [Xanthobacteraceae bacterium]|nr:hypothetical protein [Xanthobacteraceae bacterium]